MTTRASAVAWRGSSGPRLSRAMLAMLAMLAGAAVLGAGPQPAPDAFDGVRSVAALIGDDDFCRSGPPTQAGRGVGLPPSLRADPQPSAGSVPIHVVVVVGLLVAARRHW